MNSKEPKTPAQEADEAQRRQAVRKVFRSKARLISDGSLHMIKTLDISSGGVSIVADIKLEKDVTCMIELVLPMPNLQTAVVHAFVRVVYGFLSPGEGGFKTGMQFVDLNPRDLQALTEYTRA